MVKEIRNTLAALGLVGTLLLGGCETMNGADWLAFGLGAGARNQNNTTEQRKAYSYLEETAREQARRQHEKDIATARMQNERTVAEINSSRESDKTTQEVNVYTGNQQRETSTRVQQEGKEDEWTVYNKNLEERRANQETRISRSQQRVVSRAPERETPPRDQQRGTSRQDSFSMTFNTWRDYNGDNRIDLSNELSGVKDIFEKDEPIELYFQYKTSENVTGKRLRVRIFGPEDNLKREESLVTPFHNFYTMYKPLEVSSWKPGVYTAEWYSEEDKLLDSHGFRISQREQEAQVTRTQSRSREIPYDEWGVYTLPRPPRETAEFLHPLLLAEPVPPKELTRTTSR